MRALSFTWSRCGSSIPDQEYDGLEWKETPTCPLRHGTRSFGMIVNIPFVDSSAENNATEFWLGTHLQGNKGVKDLKRDGPWIAPQYLERRRAEGPPSRPQISKGRT